MREIKTLLPDNIDVLQGNKISDTRTETLSYTIHLVTPLFGGGVEAGKVDQSMPIRATEIRGHLRFWWRLLYGVALGTTAMHEAEADIWGSTEKASPVSVCVKIIQLGLPEPCATYPPGKNFPKFDREKGYHAYALFPFQGDKKQSIDPAQALKNTSFELSLSFDKNADPSLRQQIEGSLWAWVNFGGIGARTRRGCGALHCLAFSPEKSDVDSPEGMKKWMESKLSSFGVSRGARAFAKKIVITTESKDVLSAWYLVIEHYKSFRQGGSVGRNPGHENRPGRSRWPEAESIRKLLGKRSALHTLQGFEDHPEGAFPRAAFGLPIITHFKDDGEPEDTELNIPAKEEKRGSSGGGRMASPLIIKPLACSKTEAVQMILQLDTPLPENIVLKKNGQEVKSFGRDAIINKDFASYRKSPMERRSPKGDVLEAFINYSKEKSFQEVLS